MLSSTSGRGSPDAVSRLPGDTVRSLALVALSLVAAGLWFARAWLVGPRFSFLWWNLFLLRWRWFRRSFLRSLRWFWFWRSLYFFV